MNPKFKEICDNPPNDRFKDYCNGTSGLGIQKEEYYLQNYLDKLQNTKEPGLLTKAVNLGTALLRHATTGFHMTSKEEIEERQQICNSCEFHNKEKNSCQLCGCRIPYKIELQSSICPYPSGDKWEKAKKERLEKLGDYL